MQWGKKKKKNNDNNNNNKPPQHNTPNTRQKRAISTEIIKSARHDSKQEQNYSSAPKY
jgi:hypothetical protein